MNWWARPSEWNRTAATPAGAELAPRHHRYFAFLSYSHKDEAVAKWLHSALEQFRIPASIAGTLTENGVVPKRLTPIFRDRHELAAAADLGAEIREALAASRFLIVLCSPAAAKSKWTNAEIDSFKRARPDGCVIAAIVEGEPFASDLPGREDEECFPPALRHRYDKRGRPTAKRAEPLAADLRDDRDGQRLGLLKIVAALLDVGLDDLVQRDYLRRQRRLAFIAAASIAGMLVTSSLAVVAVQARDTATEQRREAEGLVGFMLGDLRDKLEPLGRLDVLDSVGSRALEYYQKQDKSELSDKALAQRAKALTLIGEIANARGDLRGALSRYREALASTAEAVRRNPEDPQRLFDHAQNVFWVGYIAWQRGRLDAAAAYFAEYKRLAEQMVALSPGNKDYRLEEVYANTNLGTVLMNQHRFRQAEAVFAGSLDVAEALAAAEPRNVPFQKQVSTNLAWLADARENAGQLESALATRERQLRLLADLERGDRRDTEIQRDKMTAHTSIGRLLASRGEMRRAHEEASIGVSLSNALLQIEPENTEWLQAAALSRFELADIQLASGNIDQAAASARFACDLSERLAQKNETVADWTATKQVHCLSFRSRLALQQNEPRQALALAQQALAAARTSPIGVDRSVLIMRSLSLGSRALDGLGRQNEARLTAAQALRALPPGIELEPVDMAEVATLHRRTGNSAAARQLASTLSAMTFRHPAYSSAIKGASRS